MIAFYTLLTFVYIDLCQEDLQMCESDMIFTTQTHMTLLQRHQHHRYPHLSNPEALSAILPPSLLSDALGPLTINDIIITRKLHSMLTNNTQHIPFCTLNI